LETSLKKRDVEAQQTNSAPTFDAAYGAWYKMQVASNRWVNTASERRPIRAYEIHAKQHIGTLPLDKIRRPIIKSFMQPLFTTTTEQASQLLGFIYEVFETAYDDELIDGNPCPRKASFTIPKKNVRHAASLHFSQIPKLMDWLQKTPFSAPVKTAMRLAVVTAHRASVVSNMRWDHLDLETGEWTVPERDIEARDLGLMKSGRRFASKLPDRLMTELRALDTNRSHEVYVFSVNGRKPINAETLRRNFQKFGPITSHGFRNSFKTWCLHQEPPIDTFLVDRHVDHALAGLDKNYRRDDLFQQRAELAERYCAFVMGDGDE
jgi:integrase